MAAPPSFAQPATARCTRPPGGFVQLLMLSQTLTPQCALLAAHLLHRQTITRRPAAPPHQPLAQHLPPVPQPTSVARRCRLREALQSRAQRKSLGDLGRLLWHWTRRAIGRQTLKRTGFADASWTSIGRATTARLQGADHLATTRRRRQLRRPCLSCPSPVSVCGGLAAMRPTSIDHLPTTRVPPTPQVAIAACYALVVGPSNRTFANRGCCVRRATTGASCPSAAGFSWASVPTSTSNASWTRRRSSTTS